MHLGGVRITRVRVCVWLREPPTGNLLDIGKLIRYQTSFAPLRLPIVLDINPFRASTG